MSAALLYLFIHSVQFGAQPLLSKHFVQPGTDASSLVLGAESAKILGCVAMLLLEGRLYEALQARRSCRLSEGFLSP